MKSLKEFISLLEYKHVPREMTVNNIEKLTNHLWTTNNEKHIDSAVKSKDWMIRKHISFNPNLKSHHVDKLVNDEHDAVRQSISLHPSALTSKHIEKLSNDNSAAVRDHVASNKEENYK